MFSAVLGLFSLDLAVDLGSSSTRIYRRGDGNVVTEPSIVAIHTNSNGARRIVATGDDALPMLGRTPGDILTVQPIRHAMIRDFDVAQGLLVHLIRRLHGRNGWISPRLVVTIPASLSDMERRAVRDSCESAGAREVHLVPRPLAAAIGAELPIDQPAGHLLIDVGGGATEISVISLQSVVTTKLIEGGGEAMDEAIIRWIRDQHDVLIGRPSAEHLKKELGCASGARQGETVSVAGRSVTQGIPKAVEVSAIEIQQALAPFVDQLGASIRGLLERTAPELASDILEQGAILTGGGSQLTGLEAALRESVGIPVFLLDDPTNAAIKGAGRILEEMDLLRAIAS